MRLAISVRRGMERMSHTYTSCLVHCVWSTKNRANLIPADTQTRLWAYLGGIARENGFKSLAVGGTANHVHAFLSLPAIMPIAKAVQLLKGGSSKWIHDTFPTMREFAWQEGYAAFTVSVSNVEDTRRYIESQAEHHRAQSFEDEFIAFLHRHEIEYDARHVWG